MASENCECCMLVVRSLEFLSILLKHFSQILFVENEWLVEHKIFRTIFKQLQISNIAARDSWFEFFYVLFINQICRFKFQVVGKFRMILVPGRFGIFYIYLCYRSFWCGIENKNNIFNKRKNIMNWECLWELTE